MGDNRLKFYPPKGGEPVIANPEYREQYLSMGGRRRKSSASVSAANRVLAANGTLSSSFALSDHAQMLANGGRAESCMGAIAAAAELPRERCCIGARCAQKWWRIRFGGRWDVCSVWCTLQVLGDVSS